MLATKKSNGGLRSTAYCTGCPKDKPLSLLVNTCSVIMIIFSTSYFPVIFLILAPQVATITVILDINTRFYGNTIYWKHLHVFLVVFIAYATCTLAYIQSVCISHFLYNYTVMIVKYIYDLNLVHWKNDNSWFLSLFILFPL